VKWYRAYFPFKMASAAMTPLIPVYVRELGGGLVEASLAVALYNLAAALASIILGRVSDGTMERRKYVLGGFLGFTVAGVMFYYVASVTYALLASVIAGFTTALCVPIAVLLITETSSEDEWEREIGRFNRVGGLGWIAGLAVGTMWVRFSSDRELFAFSAVLGGISLTYAFTLIRDPPSREEVRVRGKLRGEGEGGRLKGKATGPFALYLASTFLMFTSTSLGYSLLPIFLRDMTATNSEVFLAYFSSSAVSAATYSRVERISRGRSFYVQRGASAGRAVILAVFALSWLMARSKDGVAAVIVAMMFSGFTWAILNVAGPAAAVRITLREKRGEAIGTYNAVVSVSSIAGSALSGVVAQNLGYPALFVSAASLALASIPLLRVVGGGVGRQQPPEGAC